MTTGSDLCFLSARALAGMIRARDLSAREVMAAHLAQIARVNPAVNAIVAKLPDDACLAAADDADRSVARRAQLGPLHGLPIAFKDLQAAVGFPFTRGSRIFANTIPIEDAPLVRQLRQAGAIPIGKTNVPELGMGSHTYNDVYGTTRNPYDPSKSAGGSSGGAGAALATGMLPIADGSDLGGSLRNPANFNNIVALRPSLGLVPKAPNAFDAPDFSVNGPMARTVSDVAFLLGAMTGTAVTDRLERDLRGVRVAWCPDLGGLPLDPRVRAVLESQRGTFEAIGCEVEDVCPDLAGADAIFLTIRAWRTAAELAPLVAAHRHHMKPEALGEIAAGTAVTRDELARAVEGHARLMERVRGFQQTHAFLVCAVNQVPPFEATLDWPKAIDGVAMDHYIAWMKSAYWISVTGRPAISVPAGFTPEGLPVGIQIVGREHDDAGVLQIAQAFEQATRVGSRRPAIAVYVRLECGMCRVAALLALVSLSLASSGQQPGAWTTPEPPFRIAGPLHYVGTQDLAAYLFATPAGHILLDGATAEGAPLVERSIRALGFKPEDIRVLLTSQAHFDHVGSLAYFKRLSHARVEIMRGDDRIIADGGLSDYLQGPAPTATFEKVTVDRVLSDGDTVSVGGLTLTAKLTPGHTPGCTTWITSVTEGGTTYRVVFAGSLTVNPGTRLVERPSYPGILEDYRRSITILSSLEPDIFLGAHASFFSMQAKRKKMAGGAPAEAFVDREGYRRLIAAKQADFEAEVARQKK